MDRIIQSYMESFLASQEIVERHPSKQFELFAAYCTIEQIYSENFNPADIIVGDGDDCGIDAIAILVNGLMVASKEEVDDLIDINKKLSEISFIFVQAKTSPNFNYGDMGTFGAGVKDFFSDKPQMKQNESIKEMSKIVEYIFSKATYIKKKPVCYLYYTTTGKWVDDQNCIGRMELAKEELLDLNIFSNVIYVPVDADLLQKYYRNTIDVIETEIEFSNKTVLPEIPGVKQSYLGYIDSQSYLKLIVGENGEIRKSVFYDNVRDFQGDNPVNREMEQSLRNEAEKFVLLNNGITLICKELSSIGNKFTLTDYQIVNGCQTSHVIFNNKENINKELQIPIKLIETENDDTVNRIIKATNRQTQVPDEQLIALNEFHRKLEAFYETFSGANRLYYERRSKQYNYRTDVEKVRIVSISMQIKAVASMFYDKPHLASRYYGRLLKSIDGIFNDEHKLLPYYTCAFALYRLEYLFRNKNVSMQYRKFKYFILMMMKYDLAKGKIPPMNSNKMDEFCRDILEVVSNNSKLMSEVHKLTDLIERHVEDITSMEATKTSTLVDSLKKEFIIE